MITFIKEGTASTLRLYPIGKLIPSFPTWVDLKLFDRDDQNDKLKHWELIEKDPSYINYIISEMKDKIRLRPINSFRANGNDVDVHNLFNSTGYCIFRVNQNAWSLYIVGCKSVEELSAVGVNKKNNSFMPLIVSKREDGFRILNSI
jgi:hypothetical protein